MGRLPSTSRPVCRPIRSSTALRAASTWRRIASAWGSSASPASVSRTGVRLRSKSGTPSSASSRRICWLSDGWATMFSSAARVKLRCRATETK